MENSIFSQAVNELFTEADEQTKAEIIEKVTGHIYAFIKKRVYEHQHGHLVNDISRQTSKVINGQTISFQVSLLPEAMQQEILQEANQELTRVMHQIYVAYIST